MTAHQVYLLDLKDITLASEYECWHRPGGVPQQVLDDIRAAGVSAMAIYRHADRLVMITAGIGNAARAAAVSSGASREWEKRMEHFQHAVPGAAPGVKWQPAAKIFDLSEH